MISFFWRSVYLCFIRFIDNVHILTVNACRRGEYNLIPLWPFSGVTIFHLKSCLLWIMKFFFLQKKRVWANFHPTCNMCKENLIGNAGSDPKRPTSVTSSAFKVGSVIIHTIYVEMSYSRCINNFVVTCTIIVFYTIRFIQSLIHYVHVWCLICEIWRRKKKSIIQINLRVYGSLDKKSIFFSYIYLENL